MFGDIELRAYPALDWEDTSAVTFVLASGDRAIFVGGDTLLFDGLADIARDYQIDVAVLALAKNRRDLIATDLYLDPPALTRAAISLGARRVLPIHWDIWKAWVEDPRLVAPYLQETGIELVILAPGESIAI